MSKKLRIGVLMGGPSSEHEVSLNTGAKVIENIDKSKYIPFAIKLSADGKWFIDNHQVSLDKVFNGLDLVFNALHGTFGEDGGAQALMEYYGVRYTGSGICGSALAMDKLRSREIFKLAGLNVPKTLKIRKGDNYQAVLKLFVTKVTSLPVVVKPCSNGSSVGVAIVDNQANLGKAINSAFRADRKVLVEEFIEGREVTCGVLDPALENRDGANNSLTLTADQITALPVTEIIPKKGHKFFDYNAKYKSGQSDEITPADIDKETAKKIQQIAINAHQILGCRGYSRTDMIIKGNDIYVLEVNTLPGLTSASLFPKAALAAGLTLGQLLDKIIVSSLA